MNTNRTCGCKGFNSCYICENEYGITPRDAAQEEVNKYDQVKNLCILCYQLYTEKECLNCNEIHSAFPGIKVIRNFVTANEEKELIEELDKIPWDVSQSGRRKQNFGPRANFKKRKVKVGSFNGFPKPTDFVQERFKTVPILEDYKTVEQCSIEYRPETGAHIDPHIDDCWIWGERIVQLNLLSDSFLTLIPFKGDENVPSRYNLPDVQKYPRILDNEGRVNFNPFKQAWDEKKDSFQTEKSTESFAVRIPLPRGSLLVMYGKSRYNWEHCIFRKDISSRRVVVAYRELTPTYLPNGPEESIGKDILDKARNFFDHETELS